MYFFLDAFAVVLLLVNAIVCVVFVVVIFADGFGVVLLLAMVVIFAAVIFEDVLPF